MLFNFFKLTRLHPCFYLFLFPLSRFEPHLWLFSANFEKLIKDSLGATGYLLPIRLSGMRVLVPSCFACDM